MKKLVVLAFLSVLGTSFAQQSDYQMVEQTLSYYLDGGTNNDFNTIKKAFHKNAMMKYMVRGEFVEKNVLDHFGKVVKPGPKQDRKTKIVYINITGTAGNAKVQIDYEKFSFIDYMNLIKIKGEWKIVNKIAYIQSNQ